MVFYVFYDSACPKADDTDFLERSDSILDLIFV